MLIADVFSATMNGETSVTYAECRSSFIRSGFVKRPTFGAKSVDQRYKAVIKCRLDSAPTESKAEVFSRPLPVWFRNGLCYLLVAALAAVYAALRMQ